MIDFTQYAKVYNKYCLAYFGSTKSVLEELLKIRVVLEDALPELEIYICCDDQFYVGADKTIPKSKLKNKKNEFGYVREFAGNPESLLCELVKKQS